MKEKGMTTITLKKINREAKAYLKTSTVVLDEN